jgi:hypothetical protein
MRSFVRGNAARFNSNETAKLNEITPVALVNQKLCKENHDRTAVSLLLDIQSPPAKPLPKGPDLEVIEHPKKDDRLVYLDARFKITAKTAIYLGKKQISFDDFFKLDMEEAYVSELVVKNGEVTTIVFEVDE